MKLRISTLENCFFCAKIRFKNRFKHWELKKIVVYIFFEKIVYIFKIFFCLEFFIIWQIVMNFFSFNVFFSLFIYEKAFRFPTKACRKNCLIVSPQARAWTSFTQKVLSLSKRHLLSCQVEIPKIWIEILLKINPKER